MFIRIRCYPYLCSSWKSTVYFKHSAYNNSDHSLQEKGNTAAHRCVLNMQLRRGETSWRPLIFDCEKPQHIRDVVLIQMLKLITMKNFKLEVTWRWLATISTICHVSLWIFLPYIQELKMCSRTWSRGRASQMNPYPLPCRCMWESMLSMSTQE
jgi:hypothetical protein